MAKKSNQSNSKTGEKQLEVREVRAVLKFLRQGPRKVRLVGNLLKGMDVVRARAELTHTNKRATEPLIKLLDSAIANAKNNNRYSEEQLFVKRVVVNDGPVLKRYMPRAHGRATELKKRSSHVTVILGVKEKEKDEKKTEAGSVKSEKTDSKS